MSAPRDPNRVVTMQGVSYIDGKTPVTIQVKASTGALIVQIV